MPKYDVTLTTFGGSPKEGRVGAENVFEAATAFVTTCRLLRSAVKEIQVKEVPQEFKVMLNADERDALLNVADARLGFSGSVAALITAQTKLSNAKPE